MSLQDTVVPTYNPSPMAAKALIRELRLTKRHAPGIKTLREGNIVFTTYVAVTDKFYDFNPVVLIIRANKSHIFGINVNWLSKIEKKKLLDFLIKSNFHSKSRIQRAQVIRMLKRLRFTRKAYRLYHRKAFQAPRLFELKQTEFYRALMMNMLYKTINSNK